MKAELNVFANDAPQQLAHLEDHFIDVQDLGLEHLHPAESKELAREGSSPVRSFPNLLRVIVKRAVWLHAVKKQFAVAPDYSQQVVKIVRNPPCQAAQRLHFLSLPELAFELSPLRFIPL